MIDVSITYHNAGQRSGFREVGEVAVKFGGKFACHPRLTGKGYSAIIYLKTLARGVLDAGANGCRDTPGKAFLNDKKRLRLLSERSVEAQVLFKRKVFIHCNDTVLQMMWPRLKDGLFGHHTSEFSPRRTPGGCPSLDKANPRMR